MLCYVLLAQSSKHDMCINDTDRQWKHVLLCWHYWICQLRLTQLTTQYYCDVWKSPMVYAVHRWAGSHHIWAPGFNMSAVGLWSLLWQWFFAEYHRVWSLGRYSSYCTQRILSGWLRVTVSIHTSAPMTRRCTAFAGQRQLISRKSRFQCALTMWRCGCEATGCSSTPLKPKSSSVRQAEDNIRFHGFLYE